MAHGHRSGMSRYRVILLSDTVEISCGGIRGSQRRSPLAVNTGLRVVIYVSVLLADLTRRSLLLATAYQKMIVSHYFSSAFFVVVRRNVIHGLVSLEPFVSFLSEKWQHKAESKCRTNGQTMVSK
jgi:uncharacterized membrane protein